ncbi:hypothetical protein C6P40_004554 [Pichia californica]|uniref:Uncharacterized protein n=1 Tax=Pichia californica TaxID=460514 RepID=A0A9P6WP83_9ASCO|nr:hypothetical protein C6P40_004554 [[Candida] californica]
MNTSKILDNQEFNNKSVLNHFIKEYSNKNGFNMVIKNSNSKAIYYICDYKSDNNIRCNFSIVAYHSNLLDNWKIKTKTDNNHNHNIDLDINNNTLSSQSFNKQNLIDNIILMYKNGFKPSFIEIKLKNNYPVFKNLISKKFIYDNIRNFKKREKSR